MTDRHAPGTPDTPDIPVNPPVSAPTLSLPGSATSGAAGPESAYRTAHDLLAQRDPVGALALVEPALERDPGNRGLLSLRAWAHFVRAHLTRAEADLRRLVDDDPTDVWARHALGRTLERQTRYADALPHLRLAAAMSDDVEHQTAVLRVQQRLADQAG